MPKKKDSEKVEYRREELRGLFTFGLLAVLVVIRFQNEKLIVAVGQSSFDIIPWIDITIGLWSLYAFFMVLGLSDDVIGKTFAEIFRAFSKVFLLFYFVLSAIFGMSYFSLGFPTRSFWMLWLIGICLLFIILLQLLQLRKIKPKSLKEIWKKSKIAKLDFSRWVSIIVFLSSVVALVYYPDERYLVVFFVLGIGSFIALGLVDKKQSKKRKGS